MKNQVYFPFAQSLLGENPTSTRGSQNNSPVKGIDYSIYEIPSTQQQYSKSHHSSVGVNQNVSTFYSKNLPSTNVRASYTSQVDNNEATPNSPTSMPFVIAMGRLQQQSQLQMRKFNRIKEIPTNNKTDISPIQFRRRDSKSVILKAAKQHRTLKRRGMIQSQHTHLQNKDLDGGVQIMAEIQQLANDNNQSYFNQTISPFIQSINYFYCTQQYPNKLSKLGERAAISHADNTIQHEDRNSTSIEYQGHYDANPEPLKMSWNTNMKRRNMVAHRNIYNHRPQEYDDQILPNIKQKAQNPSNKGQNVQKSNLRNLSNQSKIEFSNNVHNLSNTQNNFYSNKKMENSLQPQRYKTNEHLQRLNHSTDHQTINAQNTRSKYTTPLKTQNNLSRGHINSTTVNKQSIKSPDITLGESGLKPNSIKKDRSNERFVQTLPRGIINSRTIKAMANNQTSPEKNDIKTSAIKKDNQNIKAQQEQNYQQVQYELQPSFQKPNKNIFNIEADLKKLEKLQEQDIGEEKRLQIIYQILREQMKRSRKEILALRKLRLEQEKNAQTNIVGLQKQQKKQKAEEYFDRTLSPQLRKIIKNLTSHRHVNQYCKHCAIFENPEQYVQSQNVQGYDAQDLLSFMEKIKKLNRQLYKRNDESGEYAKKIEKVSLKEMADKMKSRNNEQSLVNIGNTNTTQGVSSNGKQRQQNNYQGNEIGLINVNSKFKFTSSAGNFQKTEKRSQSPVGSHHESQTKQAKDRLLGNYDKMRHICSTNHFFLGPYPESRVLSANRETRRAMRPYLDMVKLDIRPCSETRSYRDACLSALTMSYRDQGIQFDPKSEADEGIQAQADQNSLQMQTQFLGQDMSIATDPEAKINFDKKGNFGKVQRRAQLYEEQLPEQPNYDWKESGLYQQILSQYNQKKIRVGRSLQQFNSSKEHIVGNEQDYQENQQDANSNINAQIDREEMQQDLQNLNPENLDIYKELEVIYVASLLKKKAHSYNNPEAIKQIQVKALTTLKVLNKNLVTGDIPLDNISHFYKEPQRENVIRLLLRCKKLYEARVEAKKILLLIIIQQELFDQIKHLKQRSELQFTQQNMQLFTTGIAILKKISSDINMFKEDNKIFKAKFIFGSKDKCQEIAELQQELQDFLHNYQSQLAIDNDSTSQIESSNQVLKRIKTGDQKAQSQSINAKKSMLLEYQKLYEEDQTESKHLITQKNSVFAEEYLLEEEEDQNLIGQQNYLAKDEDQDMIQQGTPRIINRNIKIDFNSKMNSRNQQRIFKSSNRESYNSNLMRQAFAKNDIIVQEPSKKTKTLQIKEFSQVNESKNSSQQTKSRYQERDFIEINKESIKLND